MTSPKEHTVAYDVTMCIPNMAGQEARQLMTKAYKTALTIQQQQQLLTELENDPKLVYHIGLTPPKVYNKLILLLIRVTKYESLLAPRISRKQSFNSNRSFIKINAIKTNNRIF